MEGADIFEFGLGMRRDILPFFSRRIGLVNNQEVPIRVGGKINGRVGNTNFGALTVRTGGIDFDTPASTMGIIRVKQNFFKESSVGMIASYGDPLDRNGSWQTGLDFTYRTSRFQGDKNFIAGAWAMTMAPDGLDGDKTALGFKIDYPNDLWDLAMTYKRIGASFDPSLGFVPRSNVQIIDIGGVHAPRPKWNMVRQMFHEAFFRMVTDLNFRWESYRLFTAPINWRFESGDRFEFNIMPQGERIVESFEISEDVEIIPAEYKWVRYRLEAELAAKRKVSGEMSWWFGGFYGGNLNQIEMALMWKPSETIAFEIIGERNIGDLPFGKFTQDLISGRIKVNLTPNLQINSLVQYDNRSQELGSNTRLRWIFHPLGDLFIVYNHNIKNIEERWSKDSNQLLVKFQYTFRY